MGQTILPGLVALSLLTVAAAAQDESAFAGGIVALVPEAGAVTNPWSLTMDDLEFRFPAVARAIRNPDTYVEPTDGEQAAISAFFEELGDRDGVRVDDRLFVVTPAMATAEPFDDQEVTTQNDPKADGASPGPVVGLMLALVGAVALSRRRA